MPKVGPESLSLTSNGASVDSPVPREQLDREVHPRVTLAHLGEGELRGGCGEVRRQVPPPVGVVPNLWADQQSPEKREGDHNK